MYATGQAAVADSAAAADSAAKRAACATTAAATADFGIDQNGTAI